MCVCVHVCMSASEPFLLSLILFPMLFEKQFVISLSLCALWLEAKEEYLQYVHH